VTSGRLFFIGNRQRPDIISSFLVVSFVAAITIREGFTSPTPAKVFGLATWNFLNITRSVNLRFAQLNGVIDPSANKKFCQQQLSSEDCSSNGDDTPRGAFVALALRLRH